MKECICGIQTFEFIGFLVGETFGIQLLMLYTRSVFCLKVGFNVIAGFFGLPGVPCAHVEGWFKSMLAVAWSIKAEFYLEGAEPLHLDVIEEII